MSNPLPPFRRVATTHDSQGRAIIGHDGLLDLQKAGETAAIGQAWRTTSFPNDNHKDEDPALLPPLPSGMNCDPNGTAINAIDIGPGGTSPFHFTDTIDYGIVLQGSVDMKVDDGKEVTLGPHSIIIQRGTNHSWHNRTKEWCRIVFIVLPAKEILIDGKVREQPAQPEEEQK